MALVSRSTIQNLTEAKEHRALEKVVRAMTDAVVQRVEASPPGAVYGGTSASRPADQQTGRADSSGVQDDAQAAAVPSPPVGFGSVAVAYLFIAVSTIVAYLLWSRRGGTPAIHSADVGTMFGGLLAFAAAVERIIEPLSRLVPGRSATAHLESARAQAANRGAGIRQKDLEAVALAEAEAARARANRAMLLWGLATAIATVFSTLCGFYLLHGIAGAAWDGIPVWADALVTGLCVGSGSKPLHDVITRVQSSKS